jgi:hypothetical protein
MKPAPGVRGKVCIATEGLQHVLKWTMKTLQAFLCMQLIPQTLSALQDLEQASNLISLST